MYNDFVMVGPATDIGRTHGDAIGWHVEHRVGQLLAQAVHAPNTSQSRRCINHVGLFPQPGFDHALEP